VFTGNVLRPTCFGQGKVDAAESWRTRSSGASPTSFFYSDSTDDQLLLEQVGHPVALNPSDKLRTVARDNSGPAPASAAAAVPRLGQFIRSVAATVSLVPTFAAGLPIYALTGSRREATNFSISLFAETASALINLDLVVRGEENLWKHRPAVFVFNHQSKADVVIGAKLLRRDMAGIGKQEIKKMPVIGKVLEMGGVVMIDRKNASPAPSRPCSRWSGHARGGSLRGPGAGGHAQRVAEPRSVQERRLPPRHAGRRAHGAGGHPQRRRRRAERRLRVPPGHGGGRRAAAGGHQRLVARDHRRARARGAQHVPAHPRSAGRTGAGAGEACTAQGRGHKKAHAPEEENHGHGTQGDGGFRGDNGAQGRRLATEVRRECGPKDPGKDPGQGPPQGSAKIRRGVIPPPAGSAGGQ
jgi:hypothetical protein